MKLVMDEKLKHRLVGISVILSLGAIFLPAMMKKSSQRLENNFSVNVKLPPKPIAPNVVMTDEDQMFKTIKVSKMDKAPSTTDLSKEDFIASSPIEEDDVAFAKAEFAPAAPEKSLELALSDAARTAVKKEVHFVAGTATKAVKPVKIATKAVNTEKVHMAVKPAAIKAAHSTPEKRDVYAVQLASFAKLSNAQALVSKLQRKGYKANYVRAATRNGSIYKVYVGHSPIKNNVVKLRTQLASSMQLNGFVVNTGVS